jgi:nuclear pore complex protein Nup107
MAMSHISPPMKPAGQLSAGIAERKAALFRARDHGLDTDRVAVATAERTIDRAFEICETVVDAWLLCLLMSCGTQLLPTLVGPLPSVIMLQPPPSDAEMLLVRSIERTTFMTSTHEKALEQANVILRYFLGRSAFMISQRL